MGKKAAGSGISGAVNGTTITWTGGGQSVSWDVAKATTGLALTPLAQAAILNGFKVAGDRMTAIERDPVTKQPATVADKMARIRARVDAWASGEWTIARQASGAKVYSSAMIERAMIRAMAGVSNLDDIKRITAAQIKLGKAATYDEALQVWAGTNQVKAALKTIEAEMAAAAAQNDGEAMVAELMRQAEAAGSDDEADDDEAPV